MSKDMVVISQRSAEVAHRVDPGHWEGDLCIGKDHKSAIGTLVERTTRFVVLVHLPTAGGPPRFVTLSSSCLDPAGPARTFPELGARDPRWLCTGSSAPPPTCRSFPRSRQALAARVEREHHGLLRQYFPKGTDLARYSRGNLDAVAAQLNSRPRRTLGWDTQPSVSLNSWQQPVDHQCCDDPWNPPVGSAASPYRALRGPVVTRGTPRRFDRREGPPASFVLDTAPKSVP